MSLGRFLVIAVGAILNTGAWGAEAFPSRTVRIVVASAGGGQDVSARLFAQGLAARLGRSVLVDNRAGNNVATEVTLHALPDGHTLTLTGNALWLASYLYPDLPYDPMKEFVPISMATRTPYLLVVHPSVSAKSAAELIALAKARPGQLNYASGLGAGTPQLAGELFRTMAGVDVVSVPYKGASGGLTGVVGGEVQFTFTSASALPHVKAGRLRGLGVTTAQPTALVPGMPTVASSGLPGYVVEAALAIFAPARTPPAVIARLNQESMATLNDAQIKQKFFDLGRETTATTTAEAMSIIKAEIVRMGKVIRDAGIRE